MGDLNLRKSLEYFNHALFLDSMRYEVSPVGLSTETEMHMYLLSDIIMNLYKASSVIVGDPTKDKDYQRRYKKYGIDYEFWKERIEDLRSMRNDWDVAHYNLDKEKLKNLNRDNKYNKKEVRIMYESKAERFKFDWEGGLSEIKEKFTSVELQHRALEWNNVFSG